MGRSQGNRNAGSSRTGYAYLHNAVDDHSRLAYSEILGDERKDTVAVMTQGLHSRGYNWATA